MNNNTISFPFNTYLYAGIFITIIDFALNCKYLEYFDLKSSYRCWPVVGIECPRGARPLPGGQMSQSEPYGDEALQFTKEMCLQREVTLHTIRRIKHVLVILVVDYVK